MRPRAKLSAVLTILVIAAGTALASTVSTVDARSLIGGNDLVSLSHAHAGSCDVLAVDSIGVSPKYEFEVDAEWDASSSGDPPAEDASVDASWGVDWETSTVYHDEDSDSGDADAWVGDLEHVRAWTGGGGSFAGGGQDDFTVTAWIYSTHSASWLTGSPSEVTDVIEQDWSDALCVVDDEGGNLH